MSVLLKPSSLMLLLSYQKTPPIDPKLSGDPRNDSPSPEICDISLGSSAVVYLVDLSQSLECIFSSAYHVSEAPSRLMYLFDDLPGKANGMLSSEEILV
ncbi:hypothetical protein DSO57_1024822 [Entomophthora muscae]|uniref:Uncharacterized protein n=1 Tax=Entomophthora muscae TaxID=34485 RepID=A0ACC2TDC9_9FUNG|nr:hypothetical protein DSO57_1024822 [Entomophthora muscae]